MRAGARATEVLIIGGGIAGAAAGWALVRRGVSVIIAEAEPVCGRHTTGRSAAALLATYGPAQVRQLTAESMAFFHDPGDVVDHPLLHRRPTVYVAAAGDEHGWLALAAEVALAGELGIPAELLTPAEVLQVAPLMRPDWAAGGVIEPETCDLDVAGLHQGLLRTVLRTPGATVLTGARIVALRRDEPAGSPGGPSPRWHAVGADGSRITAQVIVNAAGAWADEIARSASVPPVGLRPLRRTAFTAPSHAPPQAGRPLADGPFLVEITGRWYVKPEGAGVLASLADETPDIPRDAVAEMADVALAIERINEATVLGLRSVQRAWAGLRTFTPDGRMLIGPDAVVPGFIWFAGLGGYGIQTAPRAGEVVADAAIAAMA